MFDLLQEQGLEHLYRHRQKVDAGMLKELVWPNIKENGWRKEIINQNNVHIACLKQCMNVRNMLSMICPRGSNLCVHSFTHSYYHCTSRHDDWYWSRLNTISLLWAWWGWEWNPLLTALLVLYVLRKILFDKVLTHKSMPQDSKIIIWLFNSHIFVISTYIYKAWNRGKQTTYARWTGGLPGWIILIPFPILNVLGCWSGSITWKV